MADDFPLATKPDPSPFLICDGCGSAMTDEELAYKRQAFGTLSCCPERKMREATREDWNGLRGEMDKLREASPFYGLTKAQAERLAMIAEVMRLRARTRKPCGARSQEGGNG